MAQQIFFVGTTAEVAHHASPLRGRLDYQIADPSAVLDLANAGDLAIFFTEHFDRFRTAVQALKKRGVATLYLIDGVLEWRNAWENSDDEPACPYTMRPVLSHKVACISSSQAQILSGWGNATKVEIVGIPRLDPLFEETTHTLFAPSKAAVDRKRRLLVVTAKCPAYTAQQRSVLLRSLNDLKAVIDTDATIEPIWRLTAGLDRELSVDNQLGDLTGAELAETLQQVDAVVSTASTAVLESMAMGLPTAVLDYHGCPSYVRSVWRMASVDQIRSTVNELFDPPANKFHYQNQLLQLELHPGSATDRLCELIQAMLAVAKKSAAENSEIRFPSRMLANGAAGAIDFEHALIYPETGEFRNDDTVVLQTELAHARREIKHLQRQLDQLNRELNQAHQIFDQINSHPIAGPIVKIRQKLLDYFGSFTQKKSTNPSPKQS